MVCSILGSPWSIFLRQNPGAERVLRRRIQDGKSCVLRGVAASTAFVHETLKKRHIDSDLPDAKRTCSRRSPSVESSPAENNLHPNLPNPPGEEASVCELKEYFTQLQLEYRHRALDRLDLCQFLKEVTSMLAKPLSELQALSNIDGQVIDCLRALLNPRKESINAPVAVSAPDSIVEANRICRVSTDSFRWFTTVLNCDRNNDELQKQYRFFMRLFHPDKFRGDVPHCVSQALEKVKSAKKALENELNKFSIRLPHMVHGLSWNLVCAIPRSRVVRLSWNHPAGQIDKYNVQVLDPCYGRYLNICVLEPDYYEEKRKFVSIQELNEFDVEERKLDKMSHLFDGKQVEFQVAAANSAGVGPYAQIKVDLSGKTFGSKVVA